MIDKANSTAKKNKNNQALYKKAALNNAVNYAKLTYITH